MMRMEAHWPSPKGLRAERRAAHSANGRGISICGARHPSRVGPQAFRSKDEDPRLACDRPPGHKVQHRAKTKAGYVWWS